MIKQAAIMFDGQIWTLPRPARHHHIIWAMNNVLDGMTPDARSIVPARGVQGFISESGQFIGREISFQLAKRYDLFIRDKPCGPPNLYSEDLW